MEDNNDVKVGKKMPSIVSQFQNVFIFVFFHMQKVEIKFVLKDFRKHFKVSGG